MNWKTILGIAAGFIGGCLLSQLMDNEDYHKEHSPSEAQRPDETKTGNNQTDDFSPENISKSDVLEIIEDRLAYMDLLKNETTACSKETINLVIREIQNIKYLVGKL